MQRCLQSWRSSYFHFLLIWSMLWTSLSFQTLILEERWSWTSSKIKYWGQVSKGASWIGRLQGRTCSRHRGPRADEREEVEQREQLETSLGPTQGRSKGKEKACWRRSSDSSFHPRTQWRKEHHHLHAASGAKVLSICRVPSIMKVSHNDRLHFSTRGPMLPLVPSQPWEHWGTLLPLQILTNLVMSKRVIFQGKKCLPAAWEWVCHWVQRWQKKKKEKKMPKAAGAGSLEEHKRAEKRLHFQLQLKSQDS